MATTSKKTNSSALTDRATAYAEAVVAGKIVAGPHVRNACRRHLKDLVDGHERGLRYDKDEAAKVIRFFETRLCLNGGQFEGLPFRLHDSQAFKIGSLFGWKRADGTRRFRRAYIEEGKGNGKSPLAAGIGLYGLAADGEAGAEIYPLASHRDQAMVLFRDAVKMVKQSPALRDRLKFSGGEGREYNIAWLKTGSFMRPLSRDAGRTGSGPRPHFGLADEVHELADRAAMEMVERGFKFRRQPLLLMITNSGTDRNSVAWEEHEHAIKVAAGHVNALTDPTFIGEPIDDTTFSYVCSLDDERTFSSFQAVEYMQTSCTCHSVPTTQIEQLTAEVFAALATTVGGGWKAASAALSTLTGQSLKLASAIAATESGLINERPKAARGSASIRSGGRTRTPIDCESTSETGWVSGPATGTQRPRSKPCGSTAWEVSSSILSLLRRMENALSASSQSGSALTTVTIPGSSEAFSVPSATLQSAFSEILQKLYSAHSTTCLVRKAELKGGKLSVPADDPLNDPSCWPKANPLLGVTITEEYLAGVVAQAKAMPGKLNGILRLHFCVWTDAETAWMTRAIVEPCLADFDPAEHHGKPIWLGLDLSQNRDITAMAAVVKTGVVEVEIATEDGPQIVTRTTYDAWIEAWTPGDTIGPRELRDKLPYSVWTKQGHLHAPPGESISYTHVAQTIAEYDRDYRVEWIAYDRFAFRRFESDVIELGLSLPFVEHPQGGLKKGKPVDGASEGLWMPGSVRLLEDALLEGRIRLRRNPLLISAIMSAVTEEDKWGNHWLSKLRSVNKIDAAVALAMAVGVEAMAQEAVAYSPWDDPSFSLVTA